MVDLVAGSLNRWQQSLIDGVEAPCADEERVAMGPVVFSLRGDFLETLER
jgi:hypothetical protein